MKKKLTNKSPVFAEAVLAVIKNSNNVKKKYLFLSSYSLKYREVIHFSFDIDFSLPGCKSALDLRK